MKIYKTESSTSGEHPTFWGGWKIEKIAGPSDYETWEDCMRLLMVACAALGYVATATFEHYIQTFKLRYKEWKDDWSVWVEA